MGRARLPSSLPPAFLLINLVNFTILLFLTTVPAPAQTNAGIATNNGIQNVQARMLDPRAEQIRTACVQGRRVICGKVMQILPDGLVVESGYTSLLNPPFTKSWRVSGTASVTMDARAMEMHTPGAPCIGLVFLTHYPKRPAIKLYDYVTILAYPAGQYVYAPVPTVKKTVRRFAASLTAAVNLNLAGDLK